MKILLCYNRSEYNTVQFYEYALRRNKEHKVIVAGVNGHDISTENSVVLSDVIKAIGIKPDLIFVMEGATNLLIYGIENSPIPTAFYGIDSHVRREYIFNEAKRYNHVFLAQKKGVADFINETGHSNVHWMPLAAEPLFHLPLELDITHDIAFVGGIDLKDVHLKRRKCLKTMIDNGLSVFVGKAIGIWLGWAYSKAKIIYNCSVNDDLNQRCFEAMACKRLLLTDKISAESGIDDLFKDGEDYVSYKDEKDCLDKAKYYLSHEPERLKIAESGYKKVIEKHTYDIRMKEMLCKIGKLTESAKK